MSAEFCSAVHDTKKTSIREDEMEKPFWRHAIYSNWHRFDGAVKGNSLKAIETLIGRNIEMNFGISDVNVIFFW